MNWLISQPIPAENSDTPHLSFATLLTLSQVQQSKHSGSYAEKDQCRNPASDVTYR